MLRTVHKLGDAQLEAFFEPIGPDEIKIRGLEPRIEVHVVGHDGRPGSEGTPGATASRRLPEGNRVELMRLKPEPISGADAGARPAVGSRGVD
jgi:hypothetical protein